jgi:hypothetical protein
MVFKLAKARSDIRGKVALVTDQTHGVGYR